MLALEERQKQLREALQHRTPTEAASESSVSRPTVSNQDEDDELPAGWSRTPQSSWVSCPIGAPVAV